MRAKNKPRETGPSLDAGFHAHYRSGVEKSRLLRGPSNLEFERTKQILLRYMPKKHATILDVGGGPGRYSFWLAEMGHTVHLIDILPFHIRQARELQEQSKVSLASIQVGDARTLDFEDEFADAVLLFGPFYHLVLKKERSQALSEAHRVLKPGGLLFVAAISRFASALDGSLRGFIRDPIFMKIVERDLRTGQHRNPTNKPGYFTTSIFHHPVDLEREIRRAKFESVRVFGVTGYAWMLPKFRQIWRDPVLRKRLMSILDRTETEPTMLGVSDHLLAIGRKK